MRMTSGSATRTKTLELGGVRLTRDGRDLLSDISWVVNSDERWVVVGSNGSGKTSLVRIACMYEHPSSGTVELLGETLGRTDVRKLRRRVSLVSPAMADMIRPHLDARDVVMCAKYAALEPWWNTYEDADRAKAEALLFAQGVGFTSRRSFGSLSSGERQRVLLSRALMSDPELVLLDEPALGLDLGGREALVDRLGEIAANPSSAPSILVTHHVEEIPSSYTHLLALRGGQVIASGPMETTLTGEVLSDTFELPLSVNRHSDGRWNARRVSEP